MFSSPTLGAKRPQLAPKKIVLLGSILPHHNSNGKDVNPLVISLLYPFLWGGQSHVSPFLIASMTFGLLLLFALSQGGPWVSYLTSSLVDSSLETKDRRGHILADAKQAFRFPGPLLLPRAAFAFGTGALFCHSLPLVLTHTKLST